MALPSEKKALIKLATETLKACRTIIDALSEKQPEPKLVGLVTASQIVGRSRVWLRKKLELGELTGYQTGRGGNWQVDPEILVKELKGYFVSQRVPVKRTRSKGLTRSTAN